MVLIAGFNYEGQLAAALQISESDHLIYRGGINMTDERHVLVIFPHPDDETFSSAGTLASYIQKGIPVTYACLTLGQMAEI